MSVLNRQFMSALMLFAALIVASPGRAQALDAPACPDTEMRVLVMGDSLADGVWSSLNRTFAKCDTLNVVRLTSVSDGLAKTSDQDWFERYLDKAGEPNDATTDVVIVQLGANDITTIRDGRTRESFNSETWDKLYSDRVAELTETLGQRSAGVYWLSLPVTGNTSWEPSYRIISQLQADAVTKAGGHFIDIHEATMFGTGDFAMNGTLNGKLLQMRAPDKVHFTKLGYDFVADQVLGDLGKVIAENNRRIALQNVELQ